MTGHAVAGKMDWLVGNAGNKPRQRHFGLFSPTSATGFRENGLSALKSATTGARSASQTFLMSSDGMTDLSVPTPAYRRQDLTRHYRMDLPGGSSPSSDHETASSRRFQASMLHPPKSDFLLLMGLTPPLRTYLDS